MESQRRREAKSRNANTMRRLQDRNLELERDNARLRLQLRNSFDHPHIGSTSGPSPAVDAVFALPDIAEHIFDQLGFADLLMASRVSKDWKDKIDHTQSLQRRLFLLCDRNAQPIVIPLKAPGIECQSKAVGIDSEPKGPSLSVCISFTSSLRPITFGAKISSMFLTQPPITEMHYWLQCLNERRRHHITNPNGITVGDVVDKAETVCNQHKACPSRQHIGIDANGDSDGNFDIRGKFVALIPCLRSHPAVREEIENRELEETERARVQKRFADREARYSAVWAAFKTARAAAVDDWIAANPGNNLHPTIYQLGPSWNDFFEQHKNLVSSLEGDSGVLLNDHAGDTSSP